MMDGKTGLDFMEDQTGGLFDKIVEKMKDSERGFPLEFTVTGGGIYKIVMVTEPLSGAAYLIGLSYSHDSVHMKFWEMGMSLDFFDDFGRVGKDLDEWASDVASHISSLLDGFAFMDWSEAKAKFDQV